MKNLLSRFVRNESGATAIEYGLIAAGIALVLVAVMPAITTGLTATFTQIGEALNP
jgi:pilus assembly protein Flp/PilA